VNLRHLGINSFGLNFSGPTSGGKTLLIRLASSVAGLNVEEGPATLDGSATVFEQRSLGHRDGIVPLDDLSHLEGDSAHRKQLAKLVTFRLAANRPKARAGQYVAANNLVDVDWRVIPLSTSEDPLWESSKGPRRVRGEEVRMINVPACVSDMGDIFDSPDAAREVGATVDQRRRFVEDQEIQTLQYQGEAFREYLSKRAADTSAVATLKRYMAEFVEVAQLPQQLRWLGRIRRLFAVLYASAALAIDYAVLPWDKRETLDAIRACMLDAMNQLVAASGTAEPITEEVKSDAVLLAEFRDRVNAANFVRIKSTGKGRAASSLDTADGIIKPIKPGGVRYHLFSQRFQKWFPDQANRERLTKLLQSRGVFRQGRRADTATRQVSLSELGGKVPCYVFSCKRAKALP
jgi:uncharacterized protein (DUF927 family)